MSVISHGHTESQPLSNIVCPKNKWGFIFIFTYNQYVFKIWILNMHFEHVWYSQESGLQYFDDIAHTLNAFCHVAKTISQPGSFVKVLPKMNWEYQKRDRCDTCHFLNQSYYDKLSLF